MYTIRTMQQKDLDRAVEWAAAEGWNPGNADAGPFYRTDPDGFFIGELDGEPVGCISAVAYDDTFGFLGFYIVKPEYRGKGYGIQLWNKATAYLGSRNVGLDGVIAQQENYKKSGYRLAYRNIRYEGVIEGVSSSGLTPLADIPFAALLEYDQLCFPVKRETFLRAWIAMPNADALAKWDGNQLRGYGMIRSCRKGYKTGPIFADNTDIAHEILLALACETKGEPLYFDVPEVNPAAVAIAEQYSMSKVFETARMYTGDFPAIDINRVFGVTTFELG